MNDPLSKAKALEEAHRKPLHPRIEEAKQEFEKTFGPVKVENVIDKAEEQRTIQQNKAKRCPACGRKEIRSSEANRRYWALLHEIAEKVKPEGRDYSAETWHTYFKQKILGSIEVSLPNGKTIQVPQTTTALDTSQFHDFSTQVEVWANGRGVFLPE